MSVTEETPDIGAEGESEVTACDKAMMAEAHAIDFSVEHPLLREWVMWYDNPGDARHICSSAQLVLSTQAH